MISAQQLVVKWLECAAAGAILLLLAKVAARRLRQPADRIKVIVMAFAAAVMVPLLIAIVPAWHLGLVAARRPSSSMPQSTSQPALETAAASAPSRSELGSETPFPAPMQAVASVGPDGGAGSNRPASLPTTGERFDPWRLAAIGLMAIHALAIALLAAEGFIAARWLRKLSGRALPVGERLADAWASVTKGRGQRVRLLVTTEINTPLTYGCLRPTLVVPRSIAEGDPAELRFCLAHEWSHVERGDLLAWRLAWFGQFALWFQPVFWMLRRELRVCQDFVADHRAANAGEHAIEYSQLLVEFARRGMSRPVAGAMAFLDRSSQLSRRVKMLLATRGVLRPRSPLGFCLLAGILSLACAALLSAVRLESVEADEVPPADAQSSDQDQARRTLRFPADRAVGTVYWRMPDGKPYVQATYADNWKSLGKTRGRVRLPADADVRLDVATAASQDLSWLDMLGPNDIQVLNLRDTDVRDDALPHVARLTGLRVVDLHCTRISDAGLRGFDALINLEEIVLDAFAVNREGFGVGDGALDVLARLPNLHNIQLRLTKVTDAGLAELAHCHSLTQLGLAGTKVSDAGLIHLTKLPRLEILSLGVYNEGANITNEGLKTVGKLTDLTWLDLSGTKITGEGLVYLKDLQKLKSLSLDSIDVAEADLVHLEPLKCLERLRLYTKHNTTDVAAEHLARIKSLRDLSAHLGVTDKGVALLASLPHLEQLFLNDGGITDSSASDIAKMKSLKWLWFQDCPISDVMLQAIAELPNLEFLMLSHTRVTGDGFQQLRDMPKLAILDIDFTSEEKQPAAVEPSPHLREIGKLMQLKDLRIKGGALVSADLKDLAGLANLEALDVSIPLDDDGAAALAKFQRLKSLEISDGALTDAALKQLSLLPQLEFAQIKGQFTDEGLLHLAGLEKLRHLWVSSPNVTDAGLLALASKVPALQYVERAKLNLEREDIAFSDNDDLRRAGNADDRAALDPTEGQPPPQFYLTDWLNAGPEGIARKQFEGKVVLVDFWGAWCGPCRELTPKLKELHEKYAQRGLLIVGVHTTGFAENMAAYVNQESLPWPVAADVDDATVTAWNVRSYPTLFLIDRGGKVRFAGLYHGDLERAIGRLLDEAVSER